MRSEALRQLSIRLQQRESSQVAAESQQGSAVPEDISTRQYPSSKISSIAQISALPQEPPQGQLSGFTGLPLDILLCITDYLDDVTIICLSTSSFRLFTTLSSVTRCLGNKGLPRCAKWLITAYLHESKVKHSQDQSSGIKSTCVLCKLELTASSPQAYHLPATNPSAIVDDLQTLYLLTLAPPNLFCKHHAKQMIRGRTSLYPKRHAYEIVRWECCDRSLCLHCGTAPSDRDQPSCRCICLVCPIRGCSSLRPVWAVSGHRELAVHRLCVRKNSARCLYQVATSLAGGGLLANAERVQKRGGTEYAYGSSYKDRCGVWSIGSSSSMYLIFMSYADHFLSSTTTTETQ